MVEKKGSLGEADYGLIAQEQMGDSVHGSMGLSLAGQFVLRGDQVFGYACFPRKWTLFLPRFIHGERPIHRGEVEPVVRPIQQLLRIGVDELGEKDSVEGGVLANEEGLFTAHTPTRENIDNRLGYMAGSFPFGDFFPGKAVDPETFWVTLFPRLNRLSH